MDRHGHKAVKHNVVLIGFMGTGKTTVGVQLARRLKYRFVDTDHEVEQRAGCSVAEIFRAQGETVFRRLERAAIHEAAQRSGCVIATGGGAVQDPQNVESLRRTGVMICLVATPQTVEARLKGSRARPLLHGSGRPGLGRADRLDQIRRLQAARASSYAAADVAIDTSFLTTQEVVKAVERAVSARQVRVELASDRNRGYTIGLAWHGLQDLGGRLATLGLGSRVAVVTDPTVRRRHGAVVLRSLRAAGFTPHLLLVPAGEQAKTLRCAQRLYDQLAARRWERQEAVLALGGGTVGDLAGFVAATYLRGVPLVQVPTTLVAQVDAGIGGKTGVNHPRAKNLIGAFYQPRLVWCDPSVLTTLPRRDFVAGLAEVVKYGVIADEGLFAFVEATIDRIMHVDRDAMLHVVARSCEIKAGIVGRDEQERGERRVLNYGHTLGHAIEAATGYRRFRHGEAVAVGMDFAARLALVLGLCGPDLVERQRRLLERLGLPIRPSLDQRRGRPARYPATAVMAAMALDKKVVRERLHFVLPEKIGRVTIREVEWSVVRRVLDGVET